jgi:hypothetical protein
MLVFLAPWLLLVIGLTIHVLLDHHPGRRSGPRLVELALLWVMVFGGVSGIVGAMGHIGPASIDTAENIGYAPSMFQWEVGFADVALGVLAILSVRYRDRWLTAAVVAIAISYGGDAVGHIIEMSGGNMNPGNVWSMPADIAQALLGVVLLILYRRGRGRLPIVPPHGVVGDLV